jgi:hypothetical protein
MKKHPTHPARARKAVPDFWWEFADDCQTIIVESTDDAVPLIARFPIIQHNGEAAIGHAQNLIADLNAGRITVKQAVQRHC